MPPVGILERAQAAARVADDVAFVTLRRQEADVLDRLEQIVVDVVRGDDAVAPELILDAAAGARLPHRLDVGIDFRLEAAVAARARRDPQIASRHVVQVQAAEIERIERAVVRAPRLGAERPARQLVLGPVVVQAPAAEHFHPAVAEDVVGRAEARSELVLHAELDRGGAVGLGPEVGDVLVLGPDAEIQCQAVAERPLILNVERLNVAAGLVRDPSVVDGVVPVGAGAGRDAAEGERAAEQEIDVAAGVVRVDVVDHVLEAVAGAQRVGAQHVEVVVVIDVEVRPLGRVEVGDQRARRVLEVAAGPGVPRECRAPRSPPRRSGSWSSAGCRYRCSDRGNSRRGR